VRETHARRYDYIAPLASYEKLLTVLLYVIIMLLLCHKGGFSMHYLKFTDFRNRSKEYFDKVEKGSSFIIIRKGKPIAKIIPFNESFSGWKRETIKVKLKKTKRTQNPPLITKCSKQIIN
jgi:prevent-host-death family protein